MQQLTLSLTFLVTFLSFSLYPFNFSFVFLIISNSYTNITRNRLDFMVKDDNLKFIIVYIFKSFGVIMSRVFDHYTPQFLISYWTHKLINKQATKYFSILSIFLYVLAQKLENDRRQTTKTSQSRRCRTKRGIIGRDGTLDCKNLKRVLSFVVVKTFILLFNFDWFISTCSVCPANSTNNFNILNCKFCCLRIYNNLSSTTVISEIFKTIHQIIFNSMFDFHFIHLVMYINLMNQ